MATVDKYINNMKTSSLRMGKIFLVSIIYIFLLVIDHKSIVSFFFIKFYEP